MNPIARRLERLERAKQGGPELAIIFCEVGETPEDATARRFPDGIPDGVDPLVISWLTPGQAEARGWA